MVNDAPNSFLKPNVTDILAEASKAQFRASDFMGAGVLRACAPAKVNLFLAVGKAQNDGYHEVQTIMHTLALHDTVYVNVVPLDGALSIASDLNEARYAFVEGATNILVSIEMISKDSSLNCFSVHVRDNIVFKAIGHLCRLFPSPQDRHIKIRIEKHIPSEAGLGGGSSDAAAALACLQQFWNVPSEILHEAARLSGADVPFFLRGGCAFYDCRGDNFVHELTPSKKPLVLIKPEGGISTAQAYQAFDTSPLFVSESNIVFARSARMADEVKVENNLTNAAEHLLPNIATAKSWLCAQLGGASQTVLMSGSGSAIFGEVDSFATASRIASAAKLQGFWSRPTSFAQIKAQAIP